MSKVRAYILRKLTPLLIKYGLKYGPTVYRYKKRYDGAKRRFLDWLRQQDK